MSLVLRLTRLSLHHPVLNNKKTALFGARNVFTTPALDLQLTPILFAEPLKKKKKLDPAIVRAREERKKKKIEKQIRRLEKNARQLKPIEECEIPSPILDDKKARERSSIGQNEDILESRVLLEKAWAKYKFLERYNDLRTIDKVVFSQQKALDELRKESEELYQEAIQIDPTLIPFISNGPVKTPKIDKYDPPDGEYVDVSKKW